MTEDERAWVSYGPPPPPVFDPWRGGEVSRGDAVSTLTDAGIDALERAMALPGRIRASAFALLEADGFLTYACEAAADAAEPERALSHVLARMGERVG